jgi:ribosomal subunit interface protein
VDIIFKGRHTDVLERFRKHATAKLTKIERLAAKAIRVDVEVSAERNPRQSGRKERVELTITSSGPAIRAEAAAEDRFAALDMALAKLESRLRRANDRRKSRHGSHSAVRLTDLPETGDREPASMNDPVPPPAVAATAASTGHASAAADDAVQIERDGDGPLVVREKFHGASPMAIDQALLEMELVGHDFFLFRDVQCGVPSVVYRRRGYQYGVIRLMETAGDGPAGEPGKTAHAQPNGRANGQPNKAARLGSG